MFSVDEFWILVVLFVCTTSAVDRPVGEIVLGLCFVCSDKSYSEVGAEIFGFFLEYLDVYSHAQASVWSVTDCCRRSTRFFLAMCLIILVRSAFSLSVKQQMFMVV